MNTHYPSNPHVNGHDIVSDPGLAQLRRYVSVLAAVAAPYAGLGGDGDPLNPVDRVGEWRLLLDIVEQVAAQQTAASAPLALVRMMPPTSARLAEALDSNGPDAFQVAHLVCYGERDMLYLEDEDGHESYAVAEHLVNLFRPSAVRLVVMDGCFSRRIAQLLVDQTGVEAVVGTRRRVSESNTVAFMSRFYAEIARGISIEAAFRSGLNELHEQADRYELVKQEGLADCALPLPPTGTRAARPLVWDGLPVLADVPLTLECLGRREELTLLTQDIPAPDYRLYTIYGPAGVGKRSLVAEYAARFGWRFPGGVLWCTCTPQTTAREIAARLACFLGLDAYAHNDAILAEINRRRVLLVLDQADNLLPVEQEAIAALIEGIEPGSWVIVNARQPLDSLAHLEGRRSYPLGPFSPKSARTLAMRLAVDRNLDTLDVDTIDDFLERTLNLPWLIVTGIELVESEGIDEALKDLAEFKPGMADPLGMYLGRRLSLLGMDAHDALVLLARVQALPDLFDTPLAGLLGGASAPDLIEILLQFGLLQRVGGGFYAVAPPVCALVQQRMPLNTTEQAEIDQRVAGYLARTWPESGAWFSRAWLNNLRGIARRQLREGRAPYPVALAQALIAAADDFRAGGLAEEFLIYAALIRNQLQEGEVLARLQIAIGEALCLLPGRQDEAGWMFQVTLRLEHTGREALAEGGRAYGRYLARVGQLQVAEQVLLRSLQLLVAERGADVILASSLAHHWARVLVEAGRLSDAVPRFEAALAGYAETKRADLSVEAQCDFAETLMQLGETDRAEDMLRRVLVTAERVAPPELTARIRQQLAGLLVAHTDELPTAEGVLSDAIADLLPVAGTQQLAAVFHDLGRVRAQLGNVADAVTCVERSRRLFECTDRLAESAAASLTLGQLRMAQGNSVAAHAILHDALDRAAAAGAEELVAQIAGVLVRVHQIRARRAAQADREFHRHTLEQATLTHTRLAELELDEYTSALDAIIRGLSGG